MRNFFAGFMTVAAFLLCTFAIGQSVTRTFIETNVVVDSVTLLSLSDGGCAASWSGRAIADDATSDSFSASRELTALGNQNKCAALLQAGAKAIAKQAGIIADAGAL